MKLFFGCAAYREVKPSTAASMVRVALCANAGIDVLGYVVVDGYGCAPNVEKIFQLAIDSGADALVYHDADMVFTPEDVKALVLLWKATPPSVGTVMAAIYPSSSDPRHVVGRPIPGGASVRVGSLEAVEADRVGFGLILIPTELLRSLDAPRYYETWDGATLTTPDVIFGHRVREIGGSLWRTRAAGGVRHHVTRLMEAGEL